MLSQVKSYQISDKVKSYRYRRYMQKCEAIVCQSVNDADCSVHMTFRRLLIRESFPGRNQCRFFLKLKLIWQRGAQQEIERRDWSLNKMCLNVHV